MSEIRQDQATKRWVVMATERAKRPRDLAPETPAEADTEEHSPKCPFCPGNEERTPPEVLAYREGGGEPDSPGWRVRVIPNAFPALRPEGEVKVREPLCFTTVTGVGAHEVIVEHPKHNANPATMTVEEVTRALMAAGQRFTALEQDRRLSYIAFFRNHGRPAGSSLTHPHTQIIATPVAPTNVREEVEEARRHYDDRLHCVYCEVMEAELEAAERVVLDTHSYLVFEPFASRWPFETWIIPKDHASMFSATSESDVRPLAEALHTTLRALHSAVGDPAYNLVLHEAPLRDSCEDYYHWHIEILPRLATAAGFELGTGIWINTVMPEESAAYLRELASG
ncbi:MAG: galactose-1-phosphate uridylyltransferase [Armatimonadota bacterium]